MQARLGEDRILRILHVRVIYYSIKPQRFWRPIPTPPLQSIHKHAE
jgi:hypothetical protein